jgi:hypothetical protein
MLYAMEQHRDTSLTMKDEVTRFYFPGVEVGVDSGYYVLVGVDSR